MKLFTSFAALTLCLATVGCSTGTTTTSSAEPDLQTDLTFEEKREKLLTYREASEVCSSDSGNCIAWTNLALHCERQLSGETTGYDKPCTAAEEFRERVTMTWNCST